MGWNIVGWIEDGRPAVRPRICVNRPVVVILSILVFGLALPAVAQYGGPRTSNTYNGHFLAPAPSVTSVGGIGASQLPPPLPSVTSLPNYNFHPHYRPYFNNNRYTHYNGGYYGGWGYVAPYYYPDSSTYGYDYVGAGPDLYSGPPPGPNDPVLHMIVEQPPSDPYGPPPEAQVYAPPPAAQPVSAPAPEVQPGAPIVLVFRNGKQQEVTNYAIMGDTLYVFDQTQTKKKIALAELDIPATVKANDDRGMEFRVPPSAKKKASAPASQSAKPDGTSSGTPPNIAALTQ